MPLGRFPIVTVPGTAIWTGALVFAGQQLGDNFEHIGRWLDPITKVVLGVLVVW